LDAIALLELIPHIPLVETLSQEFSGLSAKDSEFPSIKPNHRRIGLGKSRSISAIRHRVNRQKIIASVAVEMRLNLGTFLGLVLWGSHGDSLGMSIRKLDDSGAG
jgi:hypothetical protein